MVRFSGAQPISWTNGQGGDWGEAENWTGTPPNHPGAIAMFGPDFPTMDAVVNVDTRITLGELHLSTVHDLTLSGNGSISLDGAGPESSGIIRVVGGKGDATIAIPLEWRNDGPLEVDVSAPHSLIVNSRIMDQAGDLRVQGSGVVRVEQANTNWTGQVQIDGGTLEIRNDMALGNGRGGNNDFTQVNEGGTLSLFGSLNVQNESIRLNGGTLAGDTRPRTASPIVRAPIMLLSDSKLQGSATTNSFLVVSGNIQGNAGLQTTGSVILDGVNSYTGSTQVMSGTMVAQRTDAIATSSGVTIHREGTMRVAEPLSELPIRMQGGRIEGSSSPVPVGPIELADDSVIGGRLELVNEISGPGGLLMVGRDTTILADNSYQGVTRVQNGHVAVRARRGLGTSNSPTVLENDGVLQLNVVVPERFELSGGTLLLHPEAQNYDLPLISRGGGIDARTLPNELRSTVVLQEGTTTIRANALPEGVTGTGDLVIQGALIAGAPLAHVGSTTFSGATLRIANTYTGATIVPGGAIVQHPQAFGLSTDPVQVSGGLQVEAAIPQDIVSSGSILDFRTNYNGNITIVESDSFTELLTTATLGGTVELLDNRTILRSGRFDGSVIGPGGITVHSDGSVAIHGDNSYQGLTRIEQGEAIINSTNGLGSTAIGTQVISRGNLVVNASTNEPLTVLDDAHIQINQPLPRLPAFGGFLDTSPSRDSSSVTINAAGEYGGFTFLANGALNVRSDVTLDRLVLHGTGDLLIESDQTLTVGGELEIRSGRLNLLGRLNSDRPIRKTSNGLSEFNSLSQFDGDIDIERGLVRASLNDSLGTPQGQTTVSGDASLILGGRVVIDETIMLDNGHGFAGTGALQFSDDSHTGDVGILRGRLDLGDVGSRIGVGRGEFEIASEITGGAFIRVRSHSTDDGHLSITGGKNTFTGATDLRSGSTILKADGRLISTSQIVIGSTATLSLDNRSAGIHPDRIGDNVPLNMRGGRFLLDSEAQSTVSENLGVLTLSSGQSQIEVHGLRDENHRVTFTSLKRNPNAYVVFEVGSDQQLLFDQPPTLQNGIIGPWAISTLHLDSSTRTTGFASYGLNGVEPVGDLIDDINMAGSADNVFWNEADRLTSDRRINSLVLEGGEYDLEGHLLTIESGGVIGNRATVRGGQITAGISSGQELVFHENARVEATIVDNDSGPVNVTLVGGGRLHAQNTHTGTTRILGKYDSLATMSLVDGSIPDGGNLILDRADVTIDSGPEKFIWHLDSVELRGESKARFHSLNAARVELFSGEIEGSFLGDGVIRKSGEQTVWLAGAFNEFSGSLIVEQGMLDFHDPSRLPAASLQGGTLSLRDTRDPVEADIELAGGELQIGDVSLRGDLVVTSPSTIRAMSNRPRASRAGLSGSIQGSDPLLIVGNATRLPIGNTNPGYSGNVTIQDAFVDMQPGGLGTGPLELLVGSQLRLTIFDASEGRLAMPNRMTLDGGALVLHTDHEVGRIVGPIDVRSPSMIGNLGAHVNLSIDGAVELQNDSVLLLNGVGNTTFAGSIQVNGSATIDAQFRDSDSGPLPGTVRFTGAISAGADNSQLDLIAVDVNLEASFNIPADRTLNVLINGQEALLRIDDPSQVIQGNGVLENDVMIADQGQLKPGASAGRLVVDANLTLDSGGIYQWEIADAEPADPATDGWDMLEVGGALNITATADSPFVIQVVGLDALDRPGRVANFSADKSSTWMVVQNDAITGFDPSHIEIDHFTFSVRNPVAADSVWSASIRDDGLYLTYLVPSEIDTIHDPQEREDFVHGLLQTWFGDSNLDGLFDSADLVDVFTVGEYEDDIEGNSTWSDGDWDGDSEFTTRDLVLAFTDGGFEQGRRPMTSPVSEPTGHATTLISLLCVVIFRRKNTAD